MFRYFFLCLTYFVTFLCLCCQVQKHLKVLKCDIFDGRDFPDFYTIKSSWVGDLEVKIKIKILDISGYI